MSAITLSSLLDNPSLEPLDQLAWQRLVSDSRRVAVGDVFVALRGERVDGRDFIKDSLARGAVAVLVDSEEDALLDSGEAVPVIGVRALSQRLGALASRALGDPSAHLDVVGVTGTNGKTTTTWLVAQLLDALSVPAAVVGTLGYGRVGRPQMAMNDEQPNEKTSVAHALSPTTLPLIETGFTTPDAIAVHTILSELQPRVRAVAMEVSSHSLVQHRVAGVHFTTAVFTNLSHDHLDYHGDLKAYGKAKARLLKMPGLSHMVVNRDDAWAKSLLKKQPADVRALTYSVLSPKADIHVESLVYAIDGISGTLVTPVGSGHFVAPLVGEFNVSNLLAAIAVALLRDFPLDAILAALPLLQPAPGRMHSIRAETEQNIQVLVDYAHTPDALEKALRAARRHTDGQLWCVFGCGGDRDRDKRPVMGRVAEKAADFVIVTNDNPRRENPARIVSDILHGMHNPGRCLTIAERDKAIDLAVQQARPGDTVLIAGKGHEQQQVFADHTLPFSDELEVRRALARRADKRREGLA